MRAALCLFSFCLLPIALAGCGGGGDFSTAPASGVVLCDGEPIPNAQIFFMPEEKGSSALVGKTGFATADELGNFTVTTYEPNDGAVVGKHRVRVARPSVDEFPDFECPCAFHENEDVAVVEVVAGEMNDITIELKAKPKNYRPSEEELEDIEDARDRAAGK